MDGILIINKPKEYTSYDVVRVVGKVFETKKVGHAGTLDPLATGVLVIALNQATKVLELLQADDKEYVAEVQLGLSTDTYDVTGNALEIQENLNLQEEELTKVINSFKKSYLQEVPKYSAVKVKGKKLYEYARNNIEVELPKRMVNIEEISLLGYAPERQSYTFKTKVSKGTYIRSLIVDIGNELNIPSSMKNLVRTKSGIFALKDAHNLDDISINTKLIPIEELFDYEKIILDEDEVFKVKNGVPLNKKIKGDYVMLFDQDILLAIYQKNEGSIKPFKMFNIN